MNTPGRIPAFGLEPKFAGQISIGAPPLWRHSLSLVPVTPTAWENTFPTPFEVRILPAATRPAGFEPATYGLEIRHSPIELWTLQL